MGVIIQFFALLTIMAPGGLAIYHYFIKKNGTSNGASQQDCCCKTEATNGCSTSCTSPCK